MNIGDALAVGAVILSGGMLVAELRAARASLREQGKRIGELDQKLWFQEGYRTREREEVKRGQ